MSLSKVIDSYNEVYDFNYRSVNEELTDIQSHLEHLAFRGVRFIAKEKINVIQDTYDEIQGLLDEIFGKNDYQGYEKIDRYEVIIHPNDVARMILRGERKIGMDIIKKDTYSPAKLNALDILDKYFENGDLRLCQTEEKFDRVTKKTTQDLIKELSILPVSLADVISQERRENS